LPQALPMVKFGRPGRVLGDVSIPGYPSEVDELWPKSDCVVKGLVACVTSAETH